MPTKNRPTIVIPQLNIADAEIENAPLPGINRPGQSLFEEALTGSEEGTLSVSEYQLTMIYPDFYQSRGGLLPRDLGRRLNLNEISHAEAIKIWEERVSQGNQSAKTRMAGIRKLAEDIRETGLLHPIHIYRISPDEVKYQIIAGERRFWAYWLLSMETGKFNAIPSVIHNGPSEYIQITENEDSSPVTTVGHARQIAKLYLSLLEINSPEKTAEDDEEYWKYYRMALLGPEELTGKKRLPDRFWETIEKISNQSRQALLRFLTVLKLPTKVLTLAEDWELGLYALNNLTAAPADVQIEIAEKAIDYQLSATAIEELVKLANLPGRSTYKRKIDELDNKPLENKLDSHRTRRPPIEAQVIKVFNVLNSMDKVTGGDYRGMARLIVGNTPEAAPTMAKKLEEMASAIRAELLGGEIEEKGSQDNKGDAGVEHKKQKDQNK